MRIGRLLFRRFRRYMVQNLAMFLLLCMVMVPIYSVYYNQSCEQIIRYGSDSLNSSLNMLNSQITTMESLINKICASQEVQLLALKTTLQTKDYITLNSVNADLSSLAIANDLISGIFIFIHNSNTVVTDIGSFATLAGVSGFRRFLGYYQLSDEDTEVILRENASKNTLSFILDIELPGIDAGENDTAFIYRIQMQDMSNTSALIVFSRRGLEEMFGTEWGQVALYDFSGNLITTVQPDDFTETEVIEDSRYTVPSERYSRVYGLLKIDRKAYQLILKSAVMTIVLYGSLIILASLMLSVFSAYRSCKPLRLMIAKLIDYGYKPEKDNEMFNYFISSMDDLHAMHQHSVEYAAQLRKQLDQSLIEHYLRTPTVLTEGNILPSIEKFPQKYAVCYVVVTAKHDADLTDSDDLHFLVTMVGNKITHALDAILVLLDETSFALVLSADSDCDRQIVRLAELVEEMAAMQIPVSVVVSNITVGLSNLNRAFESARSAMPLFKGSPGLHYARHGGGACETAMEVTCKDSQLYNAVLTGNTEASLSLVNQLMSDQYGIAGLEQRYYYARMPLLLAQNALGAQAVPSPPDYSSACLPDWLCEKLCEFARALCNCVIRKCKYTSTAEKQDKDFLVYIHEHFCEDSLSVKFISEACSVHEKTLNIECRVSTGMNISAYIQQLRLDKASSMLRNTDVKVMDILKECGYNTPNAFYKAFKKAHGNSPSEYRNQFRSVSS